MPILTAEDDALRAWLIETLRGHLSHGRFELAGGGLSDWYLDCRDVAYGFEGPTVARMVDHAIVDIDVDAVGGIGFGGVPLALFVARARGKRSFAVRLETKGHGRAGKVVGPVRPGDRVALVEDVFNTGTSVCKGVEALREAGAIVAAVVCVVNRGNPSLKTVYGDVPFFSLLTASDLET